MRLDWPPPGQGKEKERPPCGGTANPDLPGAQRAPVGSGGPRPLPPLTSPSETNTRKRRCSQKCILLHTPTGRGRGSRSRSVGPRETWGPWLPRVDQ